LEWARLQKGELQFSPEKLNLSNLVKGIVEFYNEHSQAKEIKTISKVDSNLNVWVDENMVKSILRNLLSNAIKFTNKNGEISILARNIEDGMVEVSVADNGIGMDSEILNNLFRIECNIGREGTNNEPSSGLGLLLCKEFVEKNNGKIWAESQEGEGSTFFFTLPSKPFTLGK
jgi:signal transduction histidine kinase